MPDPATTELAKRGDRDACGALLREFQDPWFRMALSLLNNAEHARDAAQETALRFLRQLPTFRGDSRLLTWSMGIAINVVREMRRGGRGDLGGDDESLAALPDAGGIDPRDAAIGAERRETVAAVLKELPARQREAVVLRIFEDLSVEETAAAMRCAEGTVKATLHQALKALRLKLKENV